jgi:hypothetical protein
MESALAGVIFNARYVNIAKLNKILNQSASEKLYVHLYNYTKVIYRQFLLHKSLNNYVGI